MKIAVFVKQVPDTATKIVLKSSGDGIDDTGVKWIVNPYDEFAIEAALQCKEKVGGEVVVISAGPARVGDAVRTALAMGCDRAVRIDTTDCVLDTACVAKMLATVVQEENPDVVVGGKQAVDDDAGQVLQMVAEHLQWPVVSIIDTLELLDNGHGVRVCRPVGGGVTEIIESEFPIVLGCDKGLNAPRYPSLPGIMKAKSKPLVEKSAKELLGGMAPLVRMQQWALPPERPAGQKITGEPDDVADQLVAWLQSDVKIL